jgi:tubulin-folding cofactor B
MVAPHTDGANIRNHDLLALRGYVQAHDARQEQQRGAHNTHSLWLDITHSNLHQRHVEIKFSAGDTLADVRSRIHRQTGTGAGSQHLQVFWNNVMQQEFPPAAKDSESMNARTLGSLQFQTGMRIHVMDQNPYSLSAAGGLEDVSLVPKFKLTEAEYDAKDTNTLRSWARSQKAANPNFTLEKHAAEHAAMVAAKRCHRNGLPLPEGFALDVDGVVFAVDSDNTSNIVDKDKDKDNVDGEDFGPESCQHVTLGDRCEVTPGQRRGVVAWIGQLDTDTSNSATDNAGINMPGHWVGVVFDEPVGRSDGTVQGRRYFDTPGPQYGGMVRGKNVTPGDFPVRDCWDESDDDSDGEL